MATAATVFRDYETDGVPGSGAHKVKKPDVRQLLAGYEAIINAFTTNGGLIFASKASLDASLNYAANTMAWVLGDATVANNGIYRKIGASGTGSWTRVNDLPFSFIIASDVGAGTPNAIQATTSIPVSGSALIWTNIFEANTASPMTISFNGGTPLTVKTNTGNNVAAGGLVAGMIILGIVSGTTFRLVSDQASAAIVAAAEAAKIAAQTAQAAAEAAAAGVSLPPVAPNRMLVDNAAGTARESKTFSQVVDLLEPSLNAKFVSLNYIKAAVKVSQFCLGNGTDEDTAFSAFLAALKSGARHYDGKIDLPVQIASPKTLTNYLGELSCGADGYIIKNGSGDGLTLNNSTLTAAEVLTPGIDLRVFTTGVNSGTAFKFRGSKALSDNLIPSINVRGLELFGMTTGAGWLIGLDATQVKKSNIYGLKTRGRVPATLGVAGALDNSTLFSVYFHDGCNQVEVHTVTLDWGRYGVYVGQDVGEEMCEGVVLRGGGDVRAHRSGYVADPTQGQQFQSLGVHYDTTAQGVSFGKDSAVSTDFSRVKDGLFLRSGAEGYIGSYVAVNLNNNYSQAINNEIWTGGTPSVGGRVPWSDAVGVSAGSDVDVNKNGKAVLAGNTLVGLTTGIIMRSKSSGCRGSDNVFDAFGNPSHVAITNNGTGNTVS